MEAEGPDERAGRAPTIPYSAYPTVCVCRVSGLRHYHIGGARSEWAWLMSIWAARLYTRSVNGRHASTKQTMRYQDGHTYSHNMPSKPVVLSHELLVVLSELILAKCQGVRWTF